MRKLLFSITKKDLNIEYYSGSGAGGQHRNKHQNCIRLTHKESKTTVIATESRSRVQNLKIAFKRLITDNNFKTWVKLKASGEILTEYEINKKVDELMNEKNLKIEYGV